MTHRVIFVDPDLWTTHKETTTMSAPDAGDCRRAMATIRHHAITDWAGVKAVLDEALAINRQTELLIATIDCYTAIVELLRTNTALAAMSQFVGTIANDHRDHDWRRAATCIIARNTANKDRFNTAIIEGNELDRNAELLLAVHDIHTVLMPELRTQIGLDALGKWTTNLAGEEETP